MEERGPGAAGAAGGFAASSVAAFGRGSGFEDASGPWAAAGVEAEFVIGLA